MSMFATPEELPDDLLPYSGKLSPRFYEVRQNVAGFCQEIKTVEESGITRKAYDGLKAKARERGLWNFFLPEVSGLTVMEYAPIAGAAAAVAWGGPCHPPPSLSPLRTVRRARCLASPRVVATD
eukprot:COSAG01_NODE_20023_length_975_cov_2.283105_1_plen_124_part_00